MELVVFPDADELALAAARLLRARLAAKPDLAVALPAGRTPRGMYRVLEALQRAAPARFAEMRAFAPQWLKGCVLRDMWFEPTFHKHVGQLCSGVQIHVDDPAYDHEVFQPWRVQAMGFKAIRRLYPAYDLWRDFPYEYAFGKLPIDVINGGPGLREWVDDPASVPDDLDTPAVPDEQAWQEIRRPHLLY